LFVSIAADLVPAQNKKLLGVLGKAKEARYLMTGCDDLLGSIAKRRVLRIELLFIDDLLGFF
jgi:hypothetical protein